MQIFYEIYKFYEVAHDELIYKIEIIKGISQYLIIDSLKPYETIHFIFEDFGITIPYNELFFDKKDEEEDGFVYYFRFYSNKENFDIYEL